MWSLIVIYNDDCAPVRRAANTLGLMKLVDISPRKLLSRHREKWAEFLRS